jgi:hypothetical protein
MKGNYVKLEYIFDYEACPSLIYYTTPRYQLKIKC